MTGVIFAFRNVLFEQSYRSAVLRIPEVTTKLREAQEFVDSIFKEQSLDLVSFVASEDEYFFNYSRYRDLTITLVQVGLFERYLKTSGYPQFLIGGQSMLSPIHLISGDYDLEKTVKIAYSSEYNNNEVVFLSQDREEQLVSGRSRFLSYEAFYVKKEISVGKNLKNTKYTFNDIGICEMKLDSVFRRLLEEQGLNQYVLIGPGATDLNYQWRQDLIFSDIEVIDSIDVDPMLGWFWTFIKEMSEMQCA